MHSIAPKSHHLPDRPRTRRLPPSHPPRHTHQSYTSLTPHPEPTLNILRRTLKNTGTNFQCFGKDWRSCLSFSDSQIKAPLVQSITVDQLGNCYCHSLQRLHSERSVTHCEREKHK
jgi:hypothetical protein